ncbi:MAG: radical SAM protein, partial [Aphanizomenon sp.]
ITPDGEIKSINPILTQIPPIIQKQTYRGNTLSASTIVTEKAAWENIYMVEVVRSCPEMCRFCLASYLTLPFRTASLENSLIPGIERGLTVTNRLGLLGASVTQHPEFIELLDYI